MLISFFTVYKKQCEWPCQDPGFRQSRHERKLLPLTSKKKKKKKWPPPESREEKGRHHITAGLHWVEGGVWKYWDTCSSWQQREASRRCQGWLEFQWAALIKLLPGSVWMTYNCDFIFLLSFFNFSFKYLVHPQQGCTHGRIYVPSFNKLWAASCFWNRLNLLGVAASFF